MGVVKGQLSYYPSICLAELRKTLKKPSQDSQQVFLLKTDIVTSRGVTTDGVWIGEWIY
jgi:hypothetical protein